MSKAQGTVTIKNGGGIVNDRLSRNTETGQSELQSALHSAGRRMVLREAERESMEIFYAMREELRFYLNRTQLLETILTENGIPIPEYDD